MVDPCHTHCTTDIQVADLQATGLAACGWKMDCGLVRHLKALGIRAACCPCPGEERKREYLLRLPKCSLPHYGTDLVQLHGDWLLGSTAAQTMVRTPPQSLYNYVPASGKLVSSPGAGAPASRTMLQMTEHLGKGTQASQKQGHRLTEGTRPNCDPTHMGCCQKVHPRQLGRMKAAQESSAGPAEGKNPPESLMGQSTRFEQLWTQESPASQYQYLKGYVGMRKCSTGHYKMWPGAK